jgi:hypothetical protein
MVTPAVRREAVAHLKDAHEMSERRACSVVGCDPKPLARAIAEHFRDSRHRCPSPTISSRKMAGRALGRKAGKDYRGAE